MDMGGDLSRSGLEQPRDCRGAAAPVAAIVVKPPGALGGQGVELRPAVVLRDPPRAVDQALALKALEREEQRSRIHTEHAAAHLLDAARDAEPVHWLSAHALEDQH